MAMDAQIPENIQLATATLEKGDNPKAIQKALLTLISEIRDDAPQSEQCAFYVLATLRKGQGERGKVKAALLAHTKTAMSGSALILCKGLLGVLGIETVEDEFTAILKPERREIYDGVILDRLLTAITWLRSDPLIKKVKTLIRRLEDGQVSQAAIGNLQAMRDFAKAHRKMTKVQKKQLQDLQVRLSMDPARFNSLLQPFGISSIDELKNGEARNLVQKLSSLAARHNSEGITSRQINYIRRLVKKIGLDDDAESIIAQEVAQKSNIAEMTKEQGSITIEWLLAQPGAE
jgi:hypothetical protein